MLAYRLVSQGIGGRTVAELSDTMDVDEFLTWAAYFAIEPPLEQRSDVHVAMLMAQNYNMNRTKGRAAKRPKEFLPQWYVPDAPAKSAEDLRRAMQLQFLKLGGNPRDIGIS